MHPCFDMVLTVTILASIVLVLACAGCWVSWRHAVEVRRDARQRRARMNAHRTTQHCGEER